MKRGFVYPGKAFDRLGCFMSGELITIVAPSNSGKTTFAMDIIKANVEREKCFYINLEFDIRTVREQRRLWKNGKTKLSLTNLAPLTEEENKDKEEYIKENLSKFDYYNNPNGLKLEELINEIIFKANEGYTLFVIDTFSKIEGNLDAQKARTSQNKCMEELQELVQRLNIAIIMLHHTNRAGTFEGSQKIMDLSNVFVFIEKSILPDGRPSRIFHLMKDKYTTDADLEIAYNNGEYELIEDVSEITQATTNKPF